MEPLLRPVTNRICSIPLETSSSTTYCTIGLRATGSISLGCDLVAGSRRVPRPATGTTADRDLLDPVGNQFFHHILHDRFTRDRQHFLGLRLGSRQQAGPQTRHGNDCRSGSARSRWKPVLPPHTARSVYARPAAFPWAATW